MTPTSPLSFRRRQLLGSLPTLGLGLAASYWSAPGAFAEALSLTPAQTEGPFYPDKLPLDTDNDLIVINDSTKPSVGEITWLSGRILDQTGQPVRNALVEIWQADAQGAYLHSRSGNAEKRDALFQGFGRFLTGLKGEYLFRTIKPVPYPGRTPHIHFKVKCPGQPVFTTQCYIKGHPQNEKDMVLKGVKEQKPRDSLMADFLPLLGSKAGEIAAQFDIILGLTPHQD
jgi:protocatechuate 3,4-dioxygenase, beta subunit